jgi:hypothetical protein
LVHDTLKDINFIMSVVLHDFQITHAAVLVENELGYWVLPRSTSWFSGFMMHEYDDWRWLENFRMTKQCVLTISGILHPHL